MADTQLAISNEEKAFLLELLENSLHETRVEEHRTRVLSYREHVVRHKELIVELLKKLGTSANA
jgi:hypothetical protein